MKKYFIIPLLFSVFVSKGQNASVSLTQPRQLKSSSLSLAGNPLAEDFPSPGLVFREYVWTPGSTYGPVRKQEPSQYVSSSTATGGAALYLPNGRNGINITDLAGATRAEVMVEVLHALPGLTAKTIRVNKGMSSI